MLVLHVRLFSRFTPGSLMALNKVSETVYDVELGLLAKGCRLSFSGLNCILALDRVELYVSESSSLLESEIVL